MNDGKRHIGLLRSDIEFRRTARTDGTMPFGALPADGEDRFLPEQGIVLMTTEGCAGRAEAAPARKGGRR
ncbi:hypothetical protein I8J29_17395 [Paenibacillus sp. MWE-103]|uniref:Uncharacterized protein n=1 Tax=Paenibacillus artemisiicola TaxID=1172618 RepID=A0ABS3WCF9_9BACL|nr:hypothetical protein [Paenibacillus artemisiicola]MBO7745986.1 hypothetical protein [Paenibacillus artemisiicola]